MRRYVPRLVFAVAIAWLVALTVMIWRDPGEGATSPAALARAYESAAADNDRASMSRLAPDADDDAVRTLLHPPTCPDARPSAVADGDEALVVTAAGTSCGRLPIAQRHGRWIVDPWRRPFHNGR